MSIDLTGFFLHDLKQHKEKQIRGNFRDSQYLEFILNSEIDLLDLSTGMKFLGKIFWGLKKNLQK